MKRNALRRSIHDVAAAIGLCGIESAGCSHTAVTEPLQSARQTRRGIILWTAGATLRKAVLSPLYRIYERRLL